MIFHKTNNNTCSKHTLIDQKTISMCTKAISISCVRMQILWHEQFKSYQVLGECRHTITEHLSYFSIRTLGGFFNIFKSSQFDALHIDYTSRPYPLGITDQT
jgi:hypothetical protein